MLPVLFALACVALPAYGLVHASRVRRRRTTWTPTTGHVIRLRTASGASLASGSSVLVADYEYVDLDGVVRHGRGPTGSEVVPVGDGPRPIRLLVDPLDPSESVIVGASGTGNDPLFVTLCLAFLGVGIVMSTMVVVRS
ncbi:hypothetical protein GCM10023339_24660 [Alloalcanivorax gelatiniphagus]